MLELLQDEQFRKDIIKPEVVANVKRELIEAAVKVGPGAGWSRGEAAKVSIPEDFICSLRVVDENEGVNKSLP